MCPVGYGLNRGQNQGQGHSCVRLRALPAARHFRILRQENYIVFIIHETTTELPALRLVLCNHYTCIRTNSQVAVAVWYSAGHATTMSWI